MMKQHIEDLYPLSPMQQGMLFHSLYAPEAGIYVEQFQCIIAHKLEVAYFKRAWQHLIERYPILRTSIRTANLAQPLQVVHPQVELSWSEYDYRHLSSQEQEEHLGNFLQHDRRRGFVFTSAPLMRMALFQKADTSFHLVWSFHHLLLDGWSVSLLLEEVFSIYEALVRGDGYQPGPVRAYREYIDWLQRQDPVQAEAFWRRELQGFDTPISLTQGKQRAQQGQREEFAEQELMLAADLTRELQGLARQYHLTLSTIVQGAWALLLNRYTRASDLIFGVTVSGRPAVLPGVESMIGLFINTLPLRVRLSPGLTLAGWLSQVQDRQLAIRQYDYGSLRKIQEWSELPPGQSLFESLVVFENYPTRPELRDQFQHLEIQGPRFSERGNYPLNLIVLPGESLILRVIHDCSSLDPGTVKDILHHLHNLLSHFVRSAERPLSTLSLLSSQEREQIVTAWNATEAEYPSAQCFHQLFEAQAERTPEAIALTFGDSQLTYCELNRRANQFAHFLRRMSIGRERLVGLYLERSLEMLIALLGVLKAGGAYLPLDPAHPLERLAFMLRDARVPVLVTQQTLLANLPEEYTQVVCLERDWPVIAGESVTNPFSPCQPDNLAYVIYTSGSTGRPKGVKIAHRGLCNLTEAQQQLFALGPRDHVLQFASLSFDASIWEIALAYRAGARLGLASLEHLQPGEPLVRLLQEQAITAVTLAPSVLAALPARSCPALHTIIVAGEPCFTELVTRWSPGRRFFNAYGPSETTVCATAALCQPDEQKPSIGRPIANMQAYLLDQHFEPVPVGVTGELCIGGLGLARGYLDRPDLTADRFIPHPFSARPGALLYRTGDLARYRPDGSIEFQGRLDHQVKLRGYRIELGEIETALRNHSRIRDAVVLLREDNPGEKYLTAYLVPDSGQTPVTADLRSYLQEKLPGYMIPSMFLSLDALPLTPNNKIDVKALPRPGLSTAGFPTPPATENEHFLSEIWSSVLKRTNIGMQDNFFELGGDSILSIQIIDRARRRGLHFTLQQIFQHPTIAELAAVATTSANARNEQSLVIGPLPLTPIQHWFFEHVATDAHHCNQSLLLVGPPDPDPGLIESAVRYLLSRHDMLRARFTRQGDGWQQFIADLPDRLPFTCYDLSSLSAGEQRHAVERIAEKLQASLRFEESLVRVALFQSGPRQPARLLFVLHHLLVDALSWRVLLEDLHIIYRALSRGDEPDFSPKTTSFKRWSEELQSYAQVSTVLQERDYWLTGERAGVKPLPTDYPRTEQANLVADAHTFRCHLEASETLALLQELPRVYHTRINEVLLTALAQTLASWTGQDASLVDLEGHGREDIQAQIDLSHTVGWFTTLFPVLLKREAGKSPGEVLLSVKEQLRRIPKRGLGYGLLRYLSADVQLRRQLRALPAAEISFNYLGQFDQAFPDNSLFRPAAERGGDEHSLRGQRAYLLEISGQVAEQCLHITWRYSTHLHSQATIESLALEYVRCLRTLLAESQSAGAGVYSPSDFPLANLDAQKLNTLASLLNKLNRSGEKTQ